MIDTNVVVSAIRSRRGASFRLLPLAGTGRFEINLSVPLVLEYEEAARRAGKEIGLPLSVVDDILDYLCRIGRHRQVHFLWRPLLSDPDDDFLAELAIESGSMRIVTHNARHFRDMERFGIRAVRPGEFLDVLGERP